MTDAPPPPAAETDDDDVEQGWWLAFIKGLAVILLGVTVILTSVQVVLRFGFNAPLAWTEEVGRYLFVWSVYLGVVVAAIRNSHIRVDFLIDRLGGRWPAISLALGFVVQLLAYGFVVWFGYAFAWSRRSATFYTLEFLPQILFYLAVPVPMTLVVVHLLLQTRTVLRRLKG